MPMYDYQCHGCGHEFEVLQGINDDPLKVCPECEASQLRKKVAAPAFSFKGSGWYKDLYSSPDSSKKEGSSSTADTDKTTTQKAETESPTKPKKESTTSASE